MTNKITVSNFQNYKHTKNNIHFIRKFSRRTWVRRRTLLGFHICLWEHIKKPSFENHLPTHGCFKFTWWLKEGRGLGIIISQLKLVSKLLAHTSNPGVYWKKQPKQQAQLELCNRNPETMEGVLNRTHPTQLMQVSNYASFKTTRTWKRFSNQETKKCPFLQTNNDW